MNIPKYSKDSRLKSLILLAISLISSSRFDRRAFTIKYCFMSLSSLSSSLNLLGEIGFDKEDAIKNTALGFTIFYNKLERSKMTQNTLFIDRLIFLEYLVI